MFVSFFSWPMPPGRGRSA